MTQQEINGIAVKGVLGLVVFVIGMSLLQRADDDGMAAIGLALFLGGWALLSWGGAALAKAKGLSMASGAVLGALLLLGWIVLLVLPNRRAIEADILRRQQR